MPDFFPLVLIKMYLLYYSFTRHIENKNKIKQTTLIGTQAAPNLFTGSPRRVPAIAKR